MTLHAIDKSGADRYVRRRTAPGMPLIEGLILMTCALAGCTPHPRPAALPAASVTTTQWSYRGSAGQEIRTAHWVIYTATTAPDWIADLPAFVEGCYAQYQDLVPAPSASRSLSLYIFANWVQWDDYAARLGVSRDDIDVQSQLGGFSRRGVSAVYVDSPVNTLRAIAHTGMQQYLWQHCPADPPTWVVQALATLAEGFDQRGHKFRFEPRFNDKRFQEARVAMLKDWWLDLRTMLTLEGFQKMPNPQVAAKTYLAELWTIAAFCQNDRYYQKGFEQLRRDITTDAFQLKLEGYMAAGKEAVTPGEAAFQFYITQDLPLFWTRYHDKTIQYLGLVRKFSVADWWLALGG
jgi:hypothetical protein